MILRDMSHDLKNNNTRNVLSQYRLELCDFLHKLCITLFQVPETYLSRFFFSSITLITFAFSYCKMECELIK